MISPVLGFSPALEHFPFALTLFVIAGLDPAIHLFPKARWTRGSSPRVTVTEVGSSSSERVLVLSFSSWALVLGFGEHVARAAHCDDTPRFFWIVLDRGTDARDVDINRAVEGLDRFAFDRIHQRVA
jgi:hypothetical protein